MIDLVSPDFWPIVPLVPHWGISYFIWRFTDPHGLARSSSFMRCSLRCGRDRYLTEPLETHPTRSALLDTWMPSCFSIREVHPGSMCMISVMDLDDQYYMFDERWLHVILFFGPVAHLMPYWGIFPFWMIFTDFHGGHMCDDRWLHVIVFFEPVAHLMPYWGIFPFGWDLQIRRELCAYPYLRDVCRDDDLFAVLTIIP